MLNPDIFSMIRVASQFTKTNISTNANTLTPESAKKLILSGVSDIIVSIDGMTQGTYSQYRRGGDLTHALSMLDILVIQNRDKTVQILPQFIVFSHNQHEMTSFEEHCAALGLFPIFKAPYIREDSSFSPSDIPQYNRAIAGDVQTRKQAMKSCPNSDVCTILLDGSVVACCYDHNSEVVFGNILTESLNDIVANEKRVNFFHAMKQGCAPAFCINHCLAY